MVLNYIWIAFFLIAFVVAIGKLVIGGDTAVFTEIINASFASAKTGFEISLGLTGILVGYHEDRREGGGDTSVRTIGGSRIQQAFPGYPKRPSRDRFYLHEPIGKFTGTG